MGIRFRGLFQAIKKAAGMRARKEITIPFKAGGNLSSDVAIKNPLITHNEKADKLASQVSFCASMGITSIRPAMLPKSIPAESLLNFSSFP